jgi:hybrid polyketide synthase / nonribosomal peptide synthetase ACE1
MVKSILFSRLIAKAVETTGPFQIAFEVGPYPALKSPALQTLQHFSGERIRYSGVLKQGINDIKTFSDVLGFAWKHYAEPTIDFKRYDKLIIKGRGFRLLNGLLSYV